MRGALAVVGLLLGAELGAGAFTPVAGQAPGPSSRGQELLAAKGGPGVTPGLAQVKAPADFAIPKGANSPGAVTFSHARHRVRVEKCSTCHMKDFRMKRGGSGPITLAAKQEGKFCGACHDGSAKLGGAVVFPIDQCDSCHKD